MDLYFYNRELLLLGIMDNQRSVLWRRRFYQPGEFSVILPITEENVRLCQLGNVVSFSGAKEAGVIEEVRMTQQKLTTQIKISGRFLSSYLDRRLIRPRVNYSGTVENAMRSLITNLEEPLPIDLGELNGFPEVITFQATYKNLLTYMTKLSKSANIGFRIRPDFIERKMYFETYKGVDHSLNQSVRTRVVFSPEYRNLQTAESVDNEKLLKNVCYVGGQGEGDERIYERVGDNTLTGLDRREVYYSRSDVRMEEGMSEAEYREKLRTGGQEKLDDCVLNNSFQATCLPFGNYEYKRDYDLGDVVTVQKLDWGITTHLRMAEITEVYEHGAATIEPVFGEPLPETIDWEDND